MSFSNFISNNICRFIGCGLNPDMNVNREGFSNSTGKKEKFYYGAMIVFQYIPVLSGIASGVQHLKGRVASYSENKQAKKESKVALQSLPKAEPQESPKDSGVSLGLVGKHFSVKETFYNDHQPFLEEGEICLLSIRNSKNIFEVYSSDQKLAYMTVREEECQVLLNIISQIKDVPGALQKPVTRENFWQGIVEGLGEHPSSIVSFADGEKEILYSKNNKS